LGVVESVKYAKLTMSQTIPAHFDGQHILLDEAVELEPNTKLLVTVLPKDVEREEWLAVSANRLQVAYGEDEEEYSLELIKESNPEYESR
jgi:hypothetical protein